MKQSDLYRQNAENCMQMAEAALGEPAYNRRVAGSARIPALGVTPVAGRPGLRKS